jgi:hypothetical protein
MVAVWDLPAEGDKRIPSMFHPTTAVHKRGFKPFVIKPDQKTPVGSLLRVNLSIPGIFSAMRSSIF